MGEVVTRTWSSADVARSLGPAAEAPHDGVRRRQGHPL